VLLVTFELSMTYLIYVGSLQDCLLILGLKSYSTIQKNAVFASREMSPHYKNYILHVIYENMLLLIVRIIKAHDHILRGKMLKVSVKSSDMCNYHITTLFYSFK